MKNIEKNYWYKLDNAGKLYPSIVSSRMTTVFRTTVELYDEVEPKLLQKALNNTIERYPYFKVNLHKGLFWYYFEYTDKMPHIERETYYPSMFMKYKNKKTFPFRIMYYKKHINIEFSHSITDGFGVISFMKTLLVEYFTLQKNLVIEDTKDILTTSSKVEKEECEDAFNRYYNPKVPIPKLKGKAVHFPFALTKRGKYILISGTVSANKIKELAKSYECTVTQYITALYLDSIQEYINNQQGKKRKKMTGRIVINMPVDLRQLFPSKTRRNFFISITPEIDLRLGEFSFEEILRYLKAYMTMSINKKNISRYIARNVKNEKRLYVRLLPLWIKNLIMPIVFSRFGERGYTSSVSNLGVIILPKEIEDYISKVEVYPPPSVENKIKATIATYKDKMAICFGSTVDNTEVEKIFFRKLRKSEVNVKIESNIES